MCVHRKKRTVDGAYALLNGAADINGSCCGKAGRGAYVSATVGQGAYLKA